MQNACRRTKELQMIRELDYGIHQSLWLSSGFFSTLRMLSCTRTSRPQRGFSMRWTMGLSRIVYSRSLVCIHLYSSWVANNFSSFKPQFKPCADSFWALLAFDFKAWRACGPGWMKTMLAFSSVASTSSPGGKAWARRDVICVCVTLLNCFSSVCRSPSSPRSQRLPTRTDRW